MSEAALTCTPADGTRLIRPLISFVRDAVAYAAAPTEAAARRVCFAPFSGVSRADGRALAIAAGKRSTLLEEIARERLRLSHGAQIAARAFARALERLASVYRAQGSQALELVREVALLFNLGSDPSERPTLDALERIARAVDDAARPGAGWQFEAFARACERFAAVDGSATDIEDPSPLQALPAETPANVKRRRGHFSASSLGAYASCPRKWYYRYVCAAVEDKGSSASFFGTAVHWALERFHDETPSGEIEGPADVLQRKLIGWIDTAFDRYRLGFSTQIEFELARRRARRTAKRYLAWLIARYRRAPFDVVGTEQEASLVLDGYEFIGYIDRLDRDRRTGSMTVIDYKTGTIAESAAEYRQDVANFTDFQLPFYYWVRTAGGDKVARLMLVPLKDPRLEVRPIELEVVPIPAQRSAHNAAAGTIGIDELERAKVRMVELARLLTDEAVESFAVATDPEACSFCAYLQACRRRPPPCEDRFAR